MPVPIHMEEAVEKLTEARRRIEAAQMQPDEMAVHRQWLLALTDYVQSLTELHEYTNESIHEKLQKLFSYLGERGAFIARPP